MSSMLGKIAALYIEELAAKGEQKEPCAFLRTYFHNVQKGAADAAETLIRAMGHVLPAAAAFVDDKSNLQTDRAMAASALSYLIMPVDLIPDEGTGLAGYLDDALLTFLVLQHLEAPSKEIASWVARYSPAAEVLLSGLPTWFLESVEQFSVDIIRQVEAMKGAWQFAGGE